MTITGYIDEFYENPTDEEKTEISIFLENLGLDYEENVEMTLKVVEQSTREIVGTGSIAGKVIKCMAIDPNHRGLGLSAHILSLLVKEQFNRGKRNIFIFTSPKNIEETTGNVFTGFNVIAKTDEIVLLEMGTSNLENYLDDLKFKSRGILEQVEGPIGTIVVNCNPMTLGHQYLIETAAKECAFLFVFVVTEDRSHFPTNIRIRLVREGTSHLENVLVLEGGDYIISPATFPRYFMKEFDNISLAQARLDVTLFAEQIAPVLGINRRYVGEEPYCMVTKSYNQAMQEILIPKGIDLRIVPRKEFKGEPISASKVRDLLEKEKFNEIIDLVPPTTYNFLISKEAKPIIEHIKRIHTRH